MGVPGVRLRESSDMLLLLLSVIPTLSQPQGSEEQSTNSAFPEITAGSMESLLVLGMLLPHLSQVGLGGLLQLHNVLYALLNDNILHRPFSRESLLSCSVCGDITCSANG